MTSEQVITWSETWVLLPFLDMFNKVKFPTTAIYAWSTVKEATRDRVSNIENRDYEIIGRLYHAYVESGDSKGRVLDKTPRYYLIAEEILNIFPGSKILVITRDINDIVTSIRNTWWGGKLNLYHNWLDLRLGPRLLDSFLSAHQNDTRVLAMSYEDLLADRGRFEGELQQFLDLPTIDFSKLGQSYLAGVLGDPTKRNSAQIESGARTRRSTVVQYFLVKYVFGSGTDQHWRRRQPQLSYSFWENAMDLFWSVISLVAIAIKFSQLKATMKHFYKWS